MDSQDRVGGTRSWQDWWGWALGPPLRLETLRSPPLINGFRRGWVQNEAVTFLVPSLTTSGSHLGVGGEKNSSETKVLSRNSTRALSPLEIGVQPPCLLKVFDTH